MFTADQIELALAAAKVCRAAWVAGRKRGYEQSSRLQTEHRQLLALYEARLRSVRGAFGGDEGAAAEFMALIYRGMYGAGDEYVPRAALAQIKYMAAETTT